MKRRVIFCDAHKDYPALIDRYIRNKDPEISLYIEPDPETACEMNEENPLCRMVICEELFNSCAHETRTKIRKTGRYAFITDDRTLPQSGERCYRYRPADEIVEWMQALFDDKERTGTQVIGVFAPYGGAETEVCAYLLMKMLDEKSSAAGITFCPFSASGEKKDSGGLSTLLYRSAAAGNPAAGNITAGAFISVSDPEDIWQSGSEDLVSLLSGLKESGEIMYIIAAIPPFSAAPELLDVCDHNLIISGAAYVCGACERMFREYLKRKGRDDLMKRAVSLTLPSLPGSADREEWEGMLRHGKFCDQVREAAGLLGLM